MNIKKSIGRFSARKRAVAAVVAAAALLAANQGWLVTVTETDGGHRLGDPDAKVQLIEFISYSCPACAQFERQSEGALKLGYIHEGKVAVEVRHVLFNEVDLAATVLARCGPADKFFGNHTALLATQPQWLAARNTATPAQRARWGAGPWPQRLQAISSDLGLYQVMETRGYDVTDVDQCLTDMTQVQSIYETFVADGERFGVTSTPSFIVNGELQKDMHGWAALNERLDEKLAEPAID